jgi:hypothetical protein
MYEKDAQLGTISKQLVVHWEIVGLTMRMSQIAASVKVLRG